MHRRDFVPLISVALLRPLRQMTKQCTELKAVRRSPPSNLRAKRLVLAFVAIFAALTVAAGAFEIEGTRLRAACVSAEHAQQVFCQSFVSEIARSIDGGMFPVGKHCIPENVDQSQLVMIVKKFLDEHPQILHDPADALVTIALFKAFKCA